MRIGMNLIPLRPGHMGGAEVYFRDLLTGLLARDEHEYVLVTAPENHDTLPADGPRVRRVCVGAAAGRAPGLLQRAAGVLRRVPVVDRLRVAWKRRVVHTLAEVIERERIDLWFCPFTDLDPRRPGVPSVITVYDLQHERYPEFFDADELRHRNAFYPASCRGADHIVAISEFTRRSVIDAYGVPPERVTAIALAAGADLDWAAGTGEVERVRAAYGLPARYAFYPANTWRHKNHVRLIEGLAVYRAAHGDDLALVLTGVGKEGQPALEEAAGRVGLGTRLRMLGHVPRTDLPALYAGAACLVFPSLFEGFGIPLVEAMLAGCPIVAANATSLPEVAGDAARLFDPMDPADLARALADVVRDPQRARDLVERGRARARRFSRSTMAARTLDVFERTRAAGRASALAIDVDGVYADAWMGVEAVLSVQGDEIDSVEVRGDLPALAPIVPQELVVRAGDGEPLVIRLGCPGPFAFTVKRPGGQPGIWRIRLSPRKTFRPDRHGTSPDGRELSVRLSAVCGRTPDGRQVACVLGPA